MKLLKPEWVSHEGKPIFAVDFHPDGSRFATGGQGEDTGLVIIWNTAPVMKEVHEKDENIPKLLCTIDEHASCVNCLRWSNSGKFLASGGDDKMVMIWGLSRSSGSTVFGTGGSVINIENWKCVKILRGHSGDVLDIAWSPDDSCVASGSIDNTIIIWSTQKLGEILHTITDHDGLVKGVTFDPVGKYFASQSDDKSLRVWNTSDWSLEKKITEPFLESSGTTHVLRLSWSPDGQQVVSAHAMNNGGPVAKIIERNGWKTKMDFVGHRKAITCVRFNDRLFASNNATRSQCVCCAIGSRDRSISVWVTSLKRPLVVVNELFENSVMDMSWSKCGYFLLACSLDGSIAFMEFSKEEIGNTLSEEEKYIYHKKTYGTSIKASKSLILSSIVENPDFLKHQREQNEMIKKAKLIKAMSNSSNSGMVSPIGKTSHGTPFKSVEVKYAGGIASCSSKEKLESAEILMKQKESKTKEGKRRIVPMLLEPPADLGNVDVFVDFNAEASEFDKTLAPQGTESLLAKKNCTNDKSLLSIKTHVDIGPPLAATAASTTTTSVSMVPNKRKQDSVDTLPPKKSKKKKEKEKEKSNPSTPVKTVSEATKAITTHSYHSLIELPHPSVEKNLSIQVNFQCFKQPESKVLLEVENNLQPGGLSFLRCVKSDLQVWETCLSASVTAVTANKYTVCVSCTDKTVHMYSTKGRRLCAPLVLGAHVSQLFCHKHFLLVLTSHANIHVWNVKEMTSVLRNESLLPILTDTNESVSSCCLTDCGSPVITLTDHSVYSYHIALRNWIILTSPNDSLHLAADLASCMTSAVPKGSLHAMQAPLQRLCKEQLRTLRMNPVKQQSSSISYLESQVSTCLTINSPEEYHFWLLTYVRYIVQTGEEEKLRDICEEFLGPIHQTGNTEIWDKKVLCFEKRELLKDILPIIASNLRFQRFYTELQQQLEAINKR